MHLLQFAGSLAFEDPKVCIYTHVFRQVLISAYSDIDWNFGIA